MKVRDAAWLRLPSDPKQEHVVIVMRVLDDGTAGVVLGGTTTPPDRKRGGHAGDFVSLDPDDQDRIRRRAATGLQLDSTTYFYACDVQKLTAATFKTSTRRAACSFDFYLELQSLMERETVAPGVRNRDSSPSHPVAAPLEPANE